MKDLCSSCGSGRLVPVLDVRLTRQPGGGNPYRERCLGCSTRFGLVSKSDWQHHTHPHVLPLDADHEDEGTVIPLAEWERAEEFSDVVERAAMLRDDDFGFEVVGSEAFNRFDCPQCGTAVEGKPEECPTCGAPYKWQ